MTEKLQEKLTSPKDYNSPDELLAIVDEHDTECGCAPRKLLHTLKLLHRAVHVLVYLSPQEILLQRRSIHKDTFPLHWECVGGHVGPGESYEETALREVEEELGVRASELTFLTKIPASEHTGHEFICVYKAIITDKPHPNDQEIDRLHIVTEADLRTLDENPVVAPLSPIFLHTLKQLGFAKR